MRLVIIGDGNMGRAIATLATEHGHQVVAVIGPRENEGASWITAEHAAQIDVAIEFTKPSAATDNIFACLAHGVPVVSGTTGWYAALPALEAETLRVGGALFWAPNFSLGVALTVEVARRAGALFAAHPQFDVHVIETHHNQKVDAPSGTALALARVVEKSLTRPVPTTSVRVGHVPGTHALVLDGPFEQITLTHEARDRRVFADGALHAAEWLLGRQGVFTMRDLLRTSEAS